MADILIIGAGVMGSAIAVPAADNGHKVDLVGTPLDTAIIDALTTNRANHPTLHAPLPDSITPHQIEALTPAMAARADLIIIGVSSPGIPWILEQLGRIVRGPVPIALVTKGLHQSGASLQTFAEIVADRMLAIGEPSPVIGIGGPCIAKELADRQPGSVVYASDDKAALGAAASLMQTDYYRISRSPDAVGVEICAALKNLMSIAVSAMYSQYQERNPQQAKPLAMNPAASVFNQAVREMARLAAWLGGDGMTAYDLAGLGDLHVTVGGGRNSRLGGHLGGGMTVSAALEGPMAGQTVEGVDTGRALAPSLAAAFASGKLDPQDFPVTRSLIAAILDDAPLALDFTQLRIARRFAPDRRQHA